MIRYREDLTLAEGLSEYLSRYNLGDGGYNDRFFKIRFFWKLILTLPNIDNRVRAVKFHDLHHVLTEYETGLRGEAEIGAWEIASGCGKYYAAWILNIGSFLYGIVFYPSYVYRAFIRGRQSGNLYSGAAYDSLLLSRSIGKTREELPIQGVKVKARLSDIAYFALWALLLCSIWLAPLAIIGFAFL